MRISLIVVVLTSALATGACAQTTYPNPSNVSKPDPEPALPAGFDPFTPPISSGSISASVPVAAEWTKTAGPDSVVALTGSRFTSATGAQAGKDTQFEVFAQNGSGTFSGAASVLRLDGLKAAIMLPEGLPVKSEHLIWPVDAGPSPVIRPGSGLRKARAVCPSKAGYPPSP